MKYRSYVLDVSELPDALTEINQKQSEIASMVYASDSQQIVVVVKEKALEPLKPISKMDEEEEPEEEEED